MPSSAACALQPNLNWGSRSVTLTRLGAEATSVSSPRISDTKTRHRTVEIVKRTNIEQQCKLSFFTSSTLAFDGVGGLDDAVTLRAPGCTHEPKPTARS